MTVEYQRRLEKHYDELKWLYCELYPNGQGRFEELCAAMEQWYKERNKKWKALDRKREKQKDWYKSQKMLGMMLYIDAFADNISGLEKKLDYLKECNVNYALQSGKEAGLCTGMQCKLPASDAVPCNAEGKKRRRLCGCRLPHGTAVPWNDGRSGCPL